MIYKLDHITRVMDKTSFREKSNEIKNKAKFIKYAFNEPAGKLIFMGGFLDAPDVYYVSGSPDIEYIVYEKTNGVSDLEFTGSRFCGCFSNKGKAIESVENMGLKVVSNYEIIDCSCKGIFDKENFMISLTQGKLLDNFLGGGGGTALVL